MALTSKDLKQFRSVLQEELTNQEVRFEIKVVEFAREGKIVVPKAEEKVADQEQTLDQEPKKKKEKQKKSVSEEMMEEFSGDEEQAVEESESFGEEEKEPGV